MVLVGKQVTYCVSGAECYLEICPSESVCNVRGFFVYVSVTDPFFVVVPGAAYFDGLWTRGLCGLIRKELLCGVLWMTFS